MIPIRLTAVTLTLVCCFACATSPRQEPNQFKSIHGTVVTVADGDTLTVLDSEKRRHRIRLKSVDAPEGSQAFSAEAREGLVARLLNKDVEVRYEKTDQFGRLVGQVILDGRDVNLQLLSEGLAWFFRQYAGELSPEERIAYEEAELAARSAKRGLWSADNPIPPWEYRRSERASHASKRASREGTDEIGDVPSLASPEASIPVQRALGEDAGQAQRKASVGAERRIIGNRRSRIYHRPDCPNYADVSPQNRVYFSTSGEAEAAGYRAARNCH